MNPHNRGTYSAGMARRDRQLAALKSRLSLAHTARNKPEITRLARQVARLSQSSEV